MLKIINEYKQYHSRQADWNTIQYNQNNMREFFFKRILHELQIKFISFFRVINSFKTGAHIKENCWQKTLLLVFFKNILFLLHKAFCICSSDIICNRVKEAEITMHIYSDYSASITRLDVMMKMPCTNLLISYTYTLACKNLSSRLWSHKVITWSQLVN